MTTPSRMRLNVIELQARRRHRPAPVIDLSRLTPEAREEALAWSERIRAGGLMPEEKERARIFREQLIEQTREVEKR